ncbi:MAG: hypothetical protein LBN99_02485 [Oscillospiraceae bacterium]|jgi:hypothetical protein|nr:hypothetical protein [Oscillospiraceae bacterium]
MEPLFDAAYLLTILCSGVALTATSSAGSERFLFGVMALVLFCGDALHLAPRVASKFSERDLTKQLGFGKLAASITMTVFYVLLWRAGLLRYGADAVPGYATAAVYALAAARVALCLLPQNRWTRDGAPTALSIARNVPFCALGAAVAALFAAGNIADAVWMVVVISFACYIPVVLFARRAPKLGMLMLPKSCAYAALVLMGFVTAG